MNTGQMLLATGALILMGTTIITINRMYSRQGQILQQTEIGIYAISLATSLIEEAAGQNFDEATVNDVVTSTTSLTSASLLRPESDETTTPASTTNFDDFDDYNGLILGVKIAGVDSFVIKSRVYYVKDSNPSINISTRTWFKRMDVSVYNTSRGDTASEGADTIKVSFIFSYFNFR